jgi:hypothetical protein
MTGHQVLRKAPIWMFASPRLFARKMIPKVIRTIAPSLFFIRTSTTNSWYYTLNLLKIPLKNLSIFDSGAIDRAKLSPAKWLAPAPDEKRYSGLPAFSLRVYLDNLNQKLKYFWLDI